MRGDVILVASGLLKIGTKTRAKEKCFEAENCIGGHSCGGF